MRSGGSALGHVDDLVVRNGADGMEDLPGKALTMGGAGLGPARKPMSSVGVEASAVGRRTPDASDGRPAR